MECTPAPAAPRLASLDAYRGFIMLLMASGGLSIPKVAEKMPHSFWAQLAPYVDHVAWEGGVLWDMIQPAFMFMVGVAVPFSLAKRQSLGATKRGILGHAAIRSLVLVALGILLASNSDKARITNFAFTNVLAQIGLGYFFLVLLAFQTWRTQLIAFVSILVGYWAWFALWPLPQAGCDLSAYGMTSDNLLPGLRGHWSMNVNAAAAFDRWVLNLFPRTEPFVYNNGGYQTLNFVPSLATMLLGLLAGELLRSSLSVGQKLQTILLAAVICLGIGWLAGDSICPIVKRIWTPSWVLWSGGWVLLMLAFFYVVLDGVGWKKWALPFTVVGVNSITIYLLFQLSSPWIRGALSRHGFRDLFDGPYGPIWQRAGVLLVIWLLLVWLYRQRVFLKI